MLVRMNLRTIAVVGLLIAAAFALSSALITHDGTGAVEWIVGIVIVIGLLLLAAQTSRRALTRG
jgi:drug/metabolite transporter (DMT)-like permease